VNDAVCAMMSIDRERMLGAGWAGALHPEDRDGVVGAWRGVVREPREYSSEHRLLVDGQVRWVVERATVVRDGGGRVESFLGTVVDITAIKEAEQQLRESLAQQREMLRRETSLRRELDHRVRNNLASLLGLIAVYERSGRDPREIADAMRGKVLAMKSLHEIIASSPGSPVALAGLVEQIAAQLLTPDEIHRVELEGGAVRIPARQAGAVAIILQELFTNARKHGALSALGGCVRVRWSTEEQTGGGTLLSVAWSERDGPAVARPDRSGVGLRLVEGFAASDLRGGCDFSFDGDGFGCILRARFEAGVSTAANSQGSGVS
jgi:PAS domain S-box-containing protein